MTVAGRPVRWLSQQYRRRVIVMEAMINGWILGIFLNRASEIS